MARSVEKRGEKLNFIDHLQYAVVQLLIISLELEVDLGPFYT